MDKETKMPDGRPLWAWENQITMQSNEIQSMRTAIADISALKQVLGLIYKSWMEPTTRDWHFRIKVSDAITTPDFRHILEKYLEKI